MSAATQGSLPEGWTHVRFGDVVRNKNLTTRDPEKDGLGRIVGLTHLDSESLPIVRWDILEDETSFSRTFAAGDVLFGKRRAYQRKVGVPDFAGICSGDILVFESKDPSLLQEFLPYIVQSDAFFERAVGTSAGSLSPRTNWTQLARFEFALPPIEEQKRIVEAMMLAADARRRHEAVLSANKDLIEALLHDLAWCGADSLEPLIEAFPGEFFDGDWIESKDQSASGIRLLQLADIGSGRFLDKSDRFVSRETAVRLRCSALRPGDLLISRMANPIGRACAVPEQIGDAITAVDVCVARSECSPEERAYWIGLFNSSHWRRLCEAQAAGSTRTRISRRKLEQIPVPSIATAERERLGRTLIAAQLLDSAQRWSLEALVDVSRMLAGSSPDDRSEGCDV